MNIVRYQEEYYYSLAKILVQQSEICMAKLVAAPPAGKEEHE